MEYLFITITPRPTLPCTTNPVIWIGQIELFDRLLMIIIINYFKQYNSADNLL